jgi:hypothetical protein
VGGSQAALVTVPTVRVNMETIEIIRRCRSIKYGNWKLEILIKRYKKQDTRIQTNSKLETPNVTYGILGKHLSNFITLLANSVILSSGSYLLFLLLFLFAF